MPVDSSKALIRAVTYNGPDFEYFKKEYNDKGLLIFEDRGFGGMWTKSEITYDDSNKINKIEIGHKENNQEDKLLHVYEYTGDNYRIVTYKTHKRDIHDINTYENLVLGTEKWHEVDEIVSIREFKFENGNLISERYNNLENGEKSSSLFVYKNNKLVSETKTNSHGNVERTNFTYDNNLLKFKEYYYNNSFGNKTLYLYKDGLIEEEQTILKYDMQEYLSSTIKYFYDSKNEVIKTEHYGRFNSKMYLCKVVESSKTDNAATWKTSSIACYEIYTGYYDLNELNEANRKEKVELDFFDTVKFDDNFQTTETYDHKGNPLEYKSFNPTNHQVYERLIYHHEYNNEFQLELSLCFSVNELCEIEKKSVRRLYYR